MILEKIHSPADVKALDKQSLDTLCRELREFLVDSISRTGGHLASNLGAVELTVAIHRVFDTSKDRLVFDVGHQCYVHKALTGRQELFSTLRQLDGLSGFPKPRESVHDAFIAGLCGPWDGKGEDLTGPGLLCAGADRGRGPHGGPCL